MLFFQRSFSHTHKNSKRSFGITIIRCSREREREIFSDFQFLQLEFVFVLFVFVLFYNRMFGPICAHLTNSGPLKLTIGQTFIGPKVQNVCPLWDLNLQPLGDKPVVSWILVVSSLNLHNHLLIILMFWSLIKLCLPSLPKSKKIV